MILAIVGILMLVLSAARVIAVGVTDKKWDGQGFIFFLFSCAFLACWFSF